MASEEVRHLGERQHEAVRARDDKLRAELGKQYAGIFQGIDARVAALMRKADAVRSSDGTIPPSWLYEQSRLLNLQRQVVDEMRGFGDTAHAAISRGQLASALAGEGASLDLMETAGGVRASFSRLPTAAIDSMVGRSSRDGRPLAKLLAGLPDQAAEKAKKVLVQGVALGRSPEDTARLLKRELGANLSNYLTVARTETLGAYRDASLATYAENADILLGWEWQTAEDEGTVCDYCTDMNGRVFSVDTDFDTHPCCRCTTLPVIRT